MHIKRCNFINNLIILFFNYFEGKFLLPSRDGYSDIIHAYDTILSLGDDSSRRAEFLHIKEFGKEKALNEKTRREELKVA